VLVVLLGGALKESSGPLMSVNGLPFLVLLSIGTLRPAFFPQENRQLTFCILAPSSFPLPLLLVSFDPVTPF